MEEKLMIRRHLTVFITVALLCGWLGVLLDNIVGPQAGNETLGMAVWLIIPLFAALVLSFFDKSIWKQIGIRPLFLSNLRWYTLALLIFPIVSLVVLGFGYGMGWVNLAAFSWKPFLAGFFSVIIPNLIKNVFEEFVWRGYLVTKLIKLNLSDFKIYLLVGAVWGLWHLPYYLVFLPIEDIQSVLPIGRGLFAILALFSMICWTVLFVELYRITKSIWSVVILHSVEDSFINHLIMDGYVVLESGKEILISPIVGVITSLLYLVLGLILRKYRLNKEKYEVIP